MKKSNTSTLSSSRWVAACVEVWPTPDSRLDMERLTRSCALLDNG